MLNMLYVIAKIPVRLPQGLVLLIAVSITVLLIAAERTYRAKSNPSAQAVAAIARVPPSEFAGQRRTISRPKTNVQDAKARAQPAATTATDTAKTLLPGQFILQEGTPVKLRLSRNVSCADAHEGDSVDFEVLQDVAASGIIVIPKGSVLVGSVTEAQLKRRTGRADKLEMVLGRNYPYRHPGNMASALRVFDRTNRSLFGIRETNITGRKNLPNWPNSTATALAVSGVGSETSHC
jgi:hypothetical protein